MAFLDKNGLQHLTNKLVQGDAIKVASHRGHTVSKVLENIQRECDNVSTPNTMSIENKVNNFKVGQGKTINVVGDVEQGKIDIELKGKTYQNLITGIRIIHESSSFEDGIFTLQPPTVDFKGVTFNTLTKTNTAYTVILNVLETFTLQPEETGSSYKIQINDGKYGYYSPLKIGLNIIKIQTRETGVDNPHMSILGFTRSQGLMKFTFPILLEGDYTQTPIEELPINLESIKSSFEDGIVDIDVIGKNIINKTDLIIINDNKYIATSNYNNKPSIKLKSNTSYVVSYPSICYDAKIFL